jgi:hypothetical protein
MKTAVEWLIEELEGDDSKIARIIGLKKYNSIIQQAKEMEKQQIINAYRFPNTLVDMSSEQYYNETFKSK